MIIAAMCDTCGVLGGHDHACPRAGTCRLEQLTVDGEQSTVQVRGAEPLTEQDRAAIADLVRACRASYRDDDPEAGDG